MRIPSIPADDFPSSLASWHDRLLRTFAEINLAERAGSVVFFKDAYVLILVLKG
jgi:hypothetical protein